MRKHSQMLLFIFLFAFVILVGCDGEAVPANKESPAGVQPTTVIQEPQTPNQVEEPYPAPSNKLTVQEQSSSQGGEPYPEPVEEKVLDSETADIPPAVPPPTDHEFAPKPRDVSLERGKVFIEYVEILLLESFPVQVNLLLTGNLPTPCYELRAVAYAADDQNRIDVEVYSVIEPGIMCTQVVKPFEATIPLGAYTEGIFSVWVNGEEVGTIELP